MHDMGKLCFRPGALILGGGCGVILGELIVPGAALCLTGLDPRDIDPRGIDPTGIDPTELWSLGVLISRGIDL